MSGILVIGGYDPTGSAGVIQDSCIIRKFNIPVFSVVTAFVYENTCRVMEVKPLDILKQFKLAKEEKINFKVLKIGLVYDSNQLKDIEDFAKDIKASHIVFDPVRVASTKFGMSSLKEDDILEFSHLLSPVLMPNKKEYFELFGELSPDEAAKTYNTSLIVKGIKKIGNSIVDIIATREGMIREIFHEDLKTHDVHGTGCTLSSLLSVFLSKGFPLIEAYQHALLEFKKNLKNTVKAGCQKIFI